MNRIIHITCEKNSVFRKYLSNSNKEKWIEHSKYWLQVYLVLLPLQKLHFLQIEGKSLHQQINYNSLWWSGTKPALSPRYACINTSAVVLLKNFLASLYVFSQLLGGINIIWAWIFCDIPSYFIFLDVGRHQILWIPFLTCILALSPEHTI